jgi:hypothetical protein
VLSMFASIETVCQLSAGVVYNGLFRLPSATMPQAFGLAAASNVVCALLVRSFEADRGGNRARGSPLPQQQHRNRPPLGARACDMLCFPGANR